MAKDSGEQLVGTAKDLEAANALRYRLARLGVRLWFLVMKNTEGTYDVFAANEWGNKLPDEELTLLREEAKTFTVASNEPVYANEVVENIKDITTLS